MRTHCIFFTFLHKSPLMQNTRQCKFIKKIGIERAKSRIIEWSKFDCIYITVFYLQNVSRSTDIQAKGVLACTTKGHSRIFNGSWELQTFHWCQEEDTVFTSRTSVTSGLWWKVVICYSPSLAEKSFATSPSLLITTQRWCQYQLLSFSLLQDLYHFFTHDSDNRKSSNLTFQFSHCKKYQKHLCAVCTVIISMGILISYFYSSPNGEPPNFLMKACLGMAAGVVGSFVGTPAEVSPV